MRRCPHLADRFGTVGIRASVDLFDGGRKRAALLRLIGGAARESAIFSQPEQGVLAHRIAEFPAGGRTALQDRGDAFDLELRGRDNLLQRQRNIRSRIVVRRPGRSPALW